MAAAVLLETADLAVAVAVEIAEVIFRVLLEMAGLVAEVVLVEVVLVVLVALLAGAVAEPQLAVLVAQVSLFFTTPKDINHEIRMD